MTVLEAHVPEHRWDDLQRAYEKGSGKLPPMILQTFLLHNGNDSTLWRIATLWRSREDLEAYRKSVETPTGVLVFRAAGAEPTLSIFDVTRHASQ